VAKNYREVESKRGNKSFEPIRTAIFRGKPCDLRRHFRKGTALREMVSEADMLAQNDRTGRRFIFDIKWKSLLAKGFSQSAIDRSERICEGSGILTPARGVVKGKELNGWIVIDHDNCRTLIEDGEACYLNIVLNANPPQRKRGERRWKPRDSAQSPFQSPSPPGVSPFQSPFGSPFQSPFPANSESISDAANHSAAKELQNEAQRKKAPNSVSSVNSVNLEKENSVNPETAQEQNPLALSTSEPDCDQNQRASESLTVSNVIPEPTLEYLSDAEFDEGFLSRYEHMRELMECVTEIIIAASADPYLGRTTNAFLMRRVMVLLKQKYGYNTPKGWLPVMDKLQVPAPVRVCRKFEPPLSMRQAEELKSLLFPSEAPFWLRENGMITERE